MTIINYDFIEPDYLLPKHYDKTYIHLMIRDPKNIFSYWEISNKTKNDFIFYFGQDTWHNSYLALRFYWDEFEETIKLAEHVDNWYIHLDDKYIPSYAELGKVLLNNTFIPLAISNFLKIPKWNINFNNKKYLLLKDSSIGKSSY